jgi:hypothetical protein
MIFETAVRVANNGKKIRPKCGLPSTQQNQSITAKFFNGIDQTRTFDDLKCPP